MANLKDLIVNGTSRFLGNIFCGGGVKADTVTANKFIGDLEGTVDWGNVTNKPNDGYICIERESKTITIQSKCIMFSNVYCTCDPITVYMINPSYGSDRFIYGVICNNVFKTLSSKDATSGVIGVSGFVDSDGNSLSSQGYTSIKLTNISASSNVLTYRIAVTSSGGFVSFQYNPKLTTVSLE